MEWLSDPAAWVGLATLVVLEIVLGVDNLIFIAILSGKLPAQQRERARIIGLSLALFMRLGLLASITWVMSLTEPLLTIRAYSISWRDVILIAGGLFLLVKATTEIHDRIEPHSHGEKAASAPSFWPTVAQIVVLDAVFSLDSVITAVGMVNELAIMMAAVVIAVAAMLVASRPLTAFIVARPSLVILCLGFLLMIGLVLVADGLGAHVPKGYVYAAIGFSLLIEIINQLAMRGRRRALAMLPPRQRIADAVLKVLGGVPVSIPEGAAQAFRPAERLMVGEVLRLGDRRVDAIMTPSARVAWVDDSWPAERILEHVRANPHREFPVAQGSLKRILGVVRKEDVLDGRKPLAGLIKAGIEVRDDASVFDAIALFKKHPIELALVVDAEGRFCGLVTRTDLLEAIAGELPDLP